MTLPNQSLRIAFRTDASIEIGTGHVMRCLTLAAVLRENGAECVFICRPHDGHLINLIGEKGFPAIVLPMGAVFSEAATDENPPHAIWLGVGWAEDAQHTLQAVTEYNAGSILDWLIVDHYALDARWERHVRHTCRGLMVIDDLVDRPHHCDLLLDQGLGRKEKDYAGLLPQGAIAMTGPRYALLRPDFARLRSESLSRRVAPRLARVLVTMGGVDKDNFTSRVLDTLDRSALPNDVKITVALGPHAPWIDHVRARATAMRWPIKVMIGVPDMARVMAESDLAIGAGGTTSWERCSLGLPSITMVVAENQFSVVKTLEVSGSAIAIYDAADLDSTFSAFLAQSDLGTTLTKMSLAAARICDGNGTARVAAKLGEINA